MLSRILNIFRVAPPAPVVISDATEIATQFKRWQLRVLFFSTLGYAAFYFVRANLPVAMPLLKQDLGLTNEKMGIYLTLFGVIYGVSKFFNGFLADRANARAFMAVALCFSALLNVFFGASSAVVALGIFWMLNGWFQGMGFPPCARLMANWFPPKEFVTKFPIWNISHNVGSIGILLLCGFLVSGECFAANWRLCFFVPAVLAVAVAILLWFMLPDTPPSVGLPEVAGTHVALPGKNSHENFGAFLWQQVFSNPYIWLLAFGNFFVYAIRYGVFNWGPTMLLDVRHTKIVHAAWMVAGFEAFGAAGALLGGWLTDKLFGGRAARACVIYMALAGVCLVTLWKIHTESELVLTGLLCATGFFIYGPQCLLAIACVNLATKRAAATVVGLTSIFGYASTTLSGWGMGRLVDHFGWDAGFEMLTACAVIGTILFALTWPAKAHGYREVS
ncbi:MAG TPA: MFS transporter [Candidatus Sulfotelmatobacter sp.]|jgi:sugar phosphate permease|nr:MFS transporter [Candidatus Sulfotelmatobacter sp.]